MTKRDFTATDEQWASIGGVWCRDCDDYRPKGYVKDKGFCLFHNWDMTRHHGVKMIGCTRDKQRKRISE